MQKQLERGISWPEPGSDFWTLPPRTSPMPIDIGEGNAIVNTPRDSTPLHIVHITAELAPIAKVSHGHSTWHRLL